MLFGLTGVLCRLTFVIVSLIGVLLYQSVMVSIRHIEVCVENCPLRRISEGGAYLYFCSHVRCLFKGARVGSRKDGDPNAVFVDIHI